MTGDAPQPGDKPRDDAEPWSSGDANIAWWRTEVTGELAGVSAARPRRRRRPPTTPASANLPRVAPDAEPAFAPEALDAHAAGAQDATQALDPPPAAPAGAEQEESIADAEATAAAEAASPDEADTEDPGTPADVVHDVMVLPEPHPNRSRPTVALDRGPVPGQPGDGQTRLTKARARTAEPAMDPVRAERLENSPFWLSDAERAAAGSAWPPAETSGGLATAPRPGDVHRGQPPRRKPRTPRRPAPGLLGLVALGLVAAFFSWVSAEPFWLAVGHGDRGVATVARCTGEGVTQRCAGAFAAADGSFTVQRVTLLGVAPDGRDAGAAAPARMVGADSRQAYVGATGLMVHLRWVLGFLLVLLCGYGIAGLTGARQLETARARRGAVLTSLAGPVLLLAGFLAATY